MKKLILLIVAMAFCHTITFSQGCLPEGITFTTQEEIDNFQTNYPGCTVIEGNVYLYGSDISDLNGLSVLTSLGGDLWIEDDESLTSLNGLNNLTFIGGSLGIIVSHALTNFTGLEGLTSIGGNFDIRDNFVLTNLTGLDNLASIGGCLSIGPMPLGGSGPPTIIPNTTLTSLTGLNSLTSIGGDLNIYGNDTLTNLIALENLTSIGGDLNIGLSNNYFDVISGNSSLTGLMGLENIDAGSINNITIVDNSSLTTCNVQSLCDYLASPNGSVNIYDNATGCNNPSEVVNGCGITMTCLPFGNYYFHHQSEIDNFQDDYPGCVDLSGNIQISGTDIVNLEGLDSLHSVGGSLSIYSTGLTGFSGLDNLFSIGGNLIVYDNDSLTSLSGLESLNFLEGALKLGIYKNMGYSGNPMLTDISGLKNIEAGSLDYLFILLNPLLSDCAITSICDYLVSPNGQIDIYGNAPGCNSLEEVEAACAVVGVEEVTGESDIRIFPNPARDMLTVSLPMLTGKAQLTLFNITGEKLLEKQITQSETRVDISKLPKGMYFLRLQYENAVKVAKIIKD